MDATDDVCGSSPPGNRGGDPFAFPDEWRTEAVLGLALGIRSDEAFDRMPILADALEEAGCDDPMILNHCRHCERHTPECWALECVISIDQEFWTDAVWVAKGQALPTPAEVEAEAAAAVRLEKVGRAFGGVQRGCVLTVVALVVGLILFQVVQKLVFGQPQTPPPTTERG
jgi:hypothetical protein